MLLTESPTAYISRRVRDVLAADSVLLSAFEGNIFSADYETLENPVNAPSLYVVPSNTNPERQIGGSVIAYLDCLIMAFLPRQCPHNATKVRPTAPTLSASTSGSLSGTYKYVITATYPDGESRASAEALTTVTSKKIQVTFPSATSNSGWNVYRTKAGFTAPRWLTWQPVDITSYLDNEADNTLSDLLAPIPFYTASISDHIQRVLWANESFWNGLSHEVDPIIAVQPQADKVLSNRNLRVKTTRVTIPFRYEPDTFEII